MRLYDKYRINLKLRIFCRISDIGDTFIFLVYFLRFSHFNILAYHSATIFKSYFLKSSMAPGDVADACVPLKIASYIYSIFHSRP